MPASTIRPARRDDLARIQYLDAQAYGPEAYGHTTISQYLDLFPDLAFVAEAEGQAAGYVLGGLASAGRRGMMLALVVAPEHRGRGVGEALARRLVEALAAHAVREVFLTVHPANTRAQALYRKLGFAATGPRADYYAPGADALEMRRPA